MSKNTAFLVIDTQVNQFDPKTSVFDGSNLVSKIKSLIAKARSSDTKVVFIQHNGTHELSPDRHGSEGWKIHPELAPLAVEPVFQKYEIDAFAKTNLHEELQKLVLPT